MANLIRWKRGDYIKLGQAVSKFNKKINELQTEENKLYLPDELNYKELKNDIKTRQELNRILKSLRRFQKEDASEIYKTKAGEEITKWEINELRILKQTEIRRLNKELKELGIPDKNGLSRILMGSRREKEIIARKEKLKSLENIKGYKFKELRKNIFERSSSNYEMKKAIIYRENYLDTMKKYSHFDNYDLLMKKLESITNPLEFYEFVKVNDVAKDLTFQYNNFYGQEAFNEFVEDFGIEIKEDSMTKKIL